MNGLPENYFVVIEYKKGIITISRRKNEMDIW